MDKIQIPLSQQGFELFKGNRVKRINSTHFLVKTGEGYGSYAIELLDGKWVCDCDQGLECAHRYAVKLAALSLRPLEDAVDDSKIVCRYCGSPDISRCGFRYNAYGI